MLDAGVRQTVFVDQGEGCYEPKEVKTGRHLGDWVEIVQGLTPGERIVTSGNFLLDSESRMKQAAASVRETSAQDPVCHMTVDAPEVKAAGQFSVYQGRTYYFCNPGCKRSFDDDPASILNRQASPKAGATLAADHLSTTPDMIDRIIEFSVRNRVLVFALVAAACVAGWWSLRRVSPGRHPGPERHAGHHLLALGSEPGYRRVAGHVPIVSAMLGAPKVKSVRGFSDFGYSYVYVIFEDGTDLYWARSRTQEYLSAVQGRLPSGVATEIGPDATALGWVFQYALVDESGTHSLADLRSYQDWHLKYYLKSVPGVAEVAAVGGFGKQFQVNVDPNRLRAYNLSIARVVEAVRANNRESAGRLLEFGGTEYMVRGRGYFKAVADIENIAVDRLPGHAHSSSRHRAGRDRAGPAARDRRPGRQRRGGFGHRHHAAWPERPRRHQPRQSPIARDRARTAARREDRARL